MTEERKLVKCQLEVQIVDFLKLMRLKIFQYRYLRDHFISDVETS